MALALNDIIEVSFRGTLFGQRILNTLHYVVSVAVGSGTTEDQLLHLASDIQGGLGSVPGLKSHFLDCIAIQYTLDTIRAQRVYPARTVFQEVTSGDVGQYVVADCKTPNIAASIFKRTATPGRMGVGRMQMAGVPDDGFSSGLINPGTIGVPLAIWAADMKLNFTTSAPVQTYGPCLYNPTGAGLRFSLITSTGVEDTLRTMHRRTLRVGE